jgi:hypothetical protein
MGSSGLNGINGRTTVPGFIAHSHMATFCAHIHSLLYSKSRNEKAFNKNYKGDEAKVRRSKCKSKKESQ